MFANCLHTNLLHHIFDTTMNTTLYRPSANFYLDSRRKRANLKYPMKLRVTYDRKTRYYPLGVNLTHDQYLSACFDLKPPKELKEISIALRGHLAKAESAIEAITSFSFEAFELAYFGEKVKKGSLDHYFEKYLEKLYREDRIRSAIIYTLSKKSIQSFFRTKRNIKDENLTLKDITPSTLEEYESWMVNTEKRSYNTVGIYLRSLRAVFNEAVHAGEIKPDAYPFGKRKYQIPSTRNVKRALTKQDLAKLFYYDSSDDIFIEKARAFWFLSYQCNGMNVTDILSLRNSNLTENTISFYRTKTKRSTKSNLKPIVVPRTPFIDKIISKYGGEASGVNDYIFPVLTKEMTPVERVVATQNFTRFINQHIKRLAVKVGVTSSISTYWARHSFATNAIRAGAPMEFISESLGHADLKTTQNYWSGFEDNIKREFSEKLMDF
jgi:integrase/recombinase XerD